VHTYGRGMGGDGGPEQGISTTHMRFLRG
jgi:hypothetical protein